MNSGAPQVDFDGLYPADNGVSAWAQHLPSVDSQLQGSDDQSSRDDNDAQMANGYENLSQEEEQSDDDEIAPEGMVCYGMVSNLISDEMSMANLSCVADNRSTMPMSNWLEIWAP